ncbi:MULTISPECIES: class I SAM-dependent DNA methyltransferase [unclassified Thalassospira]|uniref:class I SAM-dependent DNA methyltransferase n=1 Tax=unclassified Thalassospira TaxID=2648997 RepID=UPI0025DD9318|nr:MULTISPECIES: class I SAM-dependent methyltransferase [unclassified Thalassospira]
MGTENPLLTRAYALAGDRDDIRAVYADWAESYDDDTLIGMGYVAPAIAAETLASEISSSDRVLDAGCGTGLVGKELHEQCEPTIDGVDLSADMLIKARQKGVYDALETADLTQKLDIKDDAYDGVISVGVFTSGHVGPSAMNELVRVIKPGAPAVITVHEKVWDKDGYAEHLEQMEQDGIAKIREIREAPYHQKEGYSCKLCILEAA